MCKAGQSGTHNEDVFVFPVAVQSSYVFDQLTTDPDTVDNSSTYSLRSKLFSVAPKPRSVVKGFFHVYTPGAVYAGNLEEYVKLVLARK